jgi:hypothetical protein
VHLPLIDDVLWKIQGFTYATCLDLNRGYYHFELDHQSKLLCGIILPWSRYVYARLPQGCMPSSDIFKGHMTKIFYNFEDVTVYIDNNILFNKTTFHHHLQRLALFFERINHKISMFTLTRISWQPIRLITWDTPIPLRELNLRSKRLCQS